MTFDNTYNDRQRAEAYAALEFPGTYYLAFRDLPEIIARHASGTAALDFGCGAGRSTRFLKSLGFSAMGVDISEQMLALARQKDPSGEYLLIDDGSIEKLGGRRVDLILSAFTFDNIPTMEKKVALFSGFKSLLVGRGRVVNLVSSPEIYTHEWASFTTKELTGNFTARAGDIVQTIMTDVPDRRPIDDVLWPDDAYRETYARADLSILEVHRPLGREEESIRWVNETKIAPWVIYVLG